MLPLDNFKSISEAGCDGVCQMTRLALSGQEKMIGLSIDALQEFVQISGKRVEQTWTALAHMEPLDSSWPDQVSKTLTVGGDIYLLAYRIGNGLSRDLTASAHEHLLAMQSETLNELGKYTQGVKKIVSASFTAEEKHSRKLRQVA